LEIRRTKGTIAANYRIGLELIVSQNPYWKPRPQPAPTQPHLTVSRYEDPPLPAHDEQIVEAHVRPQPDMRAHLNKAEAFMRFLFGTLTWGISMRMLLQFISASPDKLITRLTYVLTAPFLLPFEGIAPALEFGPLLIDVSGLVAIFCYAMLTWIAIRLMWLLLYHPGTARPASRPVPSKTSEFRVR
jgi:uncharacterized protein YggT (Ycf19 family)